MASVEWDQGAAILVLALGDKALRGLSEAAVIFPILGSEPIVPSLRVRIPFNHLFGKCAELLRSTCRGKVNIFGIGFVEKIGNPLLVYWLEIVDLDVFPPYCARLATKPYLTCPDPDSQIGTKNSPFDK